MRTELTDNIEADSRSKRMGWKDILVFADGADDGLTRVKLALDLARTHDAHLEAQVVTVMPQRPYGPASGVLEQAYQSALHAAEARGAEALAAFARLAPFGESFSGYQCETRLDQVRREVAAAARTADLVIFGQPDRASDVDTEILMGALFGGGQPCIMFPRWTQPQVYGQRALIAWKATPQAARAVHAALPLLQRAQGARLVVVDPRADEPGEERRALMRLATHLSRHGVRLEEPIVTRSTRDQVSHVIFGQIEEFRADLLVMGAYGHPRMSEFVFGGVSRDMLRESRIPLLLAH
jgi:nucleotide-binding universal stress UspA family protein